MAIQKAAIGLFDPEYQSDSQPFPTHRSVRITSLLLQSTRAAAAAYTVSPQNTSLLRLQGGQGNTENIIPLPDSRQLVQRQLSRSGCTSDRQAQPQKIRRDKIRDALRNNGIGFPVLSFQPCMSVSLPWKVSWETWEKSGSLR
ncbi:hypothetical protein RRG08_013103 [Elysia crispata]|uniref:Uncharacterized protein n=1 Tax=Elysia crispata TaxID=231223 RepID=A0AAE1A0T3_9GAST|nr:hypothetical protein RRG08_013103 [Elysia crispata]